MFKRFINLKFKPITQFYNWLFVADEKKPNVKIQERTINLKPSVVINKSTPKRARTVKGRYVADDKSTKNINEAWVGGKKPTNKSNKK